MREVDHIRQEMEFRLSLFRLMTVPHQNTACESAAQSEGEAQLEQLSQLADSGFRC